MIITNKRVPTVYAKESRDFQIIGSLFDLAFNNSKYSADLMTSLDDTLVDAKLVNLSAKTVNLDISSEQVTNNTLAIINVFKTLIKWKGTKKAITLLLNILLNVNHIDKQIKYTWDNTLKLVTINIPKDLVINYAVFEKICNYILPTGYQYQIYKREFEEKINNTNIVYDKDEESHKSKVTSALVEEIKINDNTIGYTSQIQDSIFVGIEEK